jgi:hypothetical protein
MSLWIVEVVGVMLVEVATAEAFGEVGAQGLMGVGQHFDEMNHEPPLLAQKPVYWSMKNMDSNCSEVGEAESAAVHSLGAH